MSIGISIKQDINLNEHGVSRVQFVKACFNRVTRAIKGVLKGLIKFLSTRPINNIQEP